MVDILEDNDRIVVLAIAKPTILQYDICRGLNPLDFKIHQSLDLNKLKIQQINTDIEY